MKQRAYLSIAIVGAGSHSARRQRGLSLVELMISLVVGLILIAAVFNMYSGNVRSARFTEGMQAIQENGRYAVSVLQRSFRLAGYSPIPGVTEELEAIDIENSGSEKLVVRARQAYDCNGLSTTETDGIAVNTYTLDTNTQALVCKGNQSDSADMAIVEGVDEFRILYGIDRTEGDSCEPQLYESYSDSLDSSSVVAVRFGLLVNSGNAIRNRNEAKTFVVLDKEVTSANDRLVREVFSGTVLLRNNITCAGLGA